MFRSNDYDAAITIFSPEGRLYQVEYALELVKRGAPIVGVNSPDGLVLAADETRGSGLEDPLYYRKILQIDDHIGIAIAGLSSDARVLVRLGRVYCQSNRLLYDEPADVESLASALSDQMQVYTQHGGVRPFGVSMIIAGVDASGGKLLTIDPSGSYRGYKAIALGRAADIVNKLLDEKYGEGLSLDEAITLSVEAVNAASGGDVASDVIKVAIISADERVFKRLTKEEVEKSVISSTTSHRS
jgi:proteasome alpha subunit